MSKAGKFESTLNRLHSKLIVALFVLTVAIQAAFLVVEVRTLSNSIFKVFSDQVVGMTYMNSQLGDLISLQRNLETISSSLAKALPIELKVMRDSDQKLLVHSKSINFSEVSIFQLEKTASFSAQPFGEIYLSTKFDYSPLMLIMLLRTILFSVLLAGGLMVAQIAIRRINRISLVSIDHLSEWLESLTPEQLDSGELSVPKMSSDPDLITDAFDRLLFRINILKQEAMRLASMRTQAELASQVSHDIRSPLASLQAVIHNVQGLDEETRTQVHTAATRIRDIANGLLAKNREVNTILGLSPIAQMPVSISNEPRTVEILSALIESAVSQKRLQYQERRDVNISFSFSQTTALFVEVQANEFFRIFSNVVNNSVEALDGGGRIEVSLQKVEGQARIQIEDNGKGIPPELLLKVVERGGTFGKKDGNGLGLSHAKASVEEWRGCFILESTVGKGTRITIDLPIVESPSWYASKVTILPKMTVVIVSDDSFTHRFWNDRLNKIRFRGKQVHLYTFAEAIDWYRNNLLVEDVLYLCEYEFAGNPQTGLDLVEMIGISTQAILITNLWDKQVFRVRCEKLGLKILPTFLASAIDIIY